MSIENKHKVRLISVVDRSRRVLFDVSPSFSESGSVNYSALNPVHMPGGIQVYKNTESRKFSITAKFISRNVPDAITNMHYLRLLKSWRFPYFGINSATGTARNPESEEQELLGAPPEVLFLYAYSENNRPLQVTNINKIPVVMNSLDIQYPTEVDYIVIDGDTDPFPIRLNVSIALLETHSPKEFEKFSLQDYRNGRLVNF